VASFVGLLEVVSGVLWAWLLLTQVPGPLQVVGGVLLLAGIVIVRLGEPDGREAASVDLGAEGGAAITGRPLADGREVTVATRAP
jgi:hypothetical protein